MTGERADVVIVGDGPAGSALATACVQRGVDVLLVGRDDEWTATYGGWVDDLAGAGDRLGIGPAVDWFEHTLTSIAAFTDRAHTLERPYGVISNTRMRSDLRRSVRHVVGEADRVEPGTAWHHVLLSDGRAVHARLVIDAAGWPSRLVPPDRRSGRGPAWQTAFGVVLDRPPEGDLARPVLMDFRPVRATGTSADTRDSTIGPAGVATFGYALPVGDGWLVEETVLAARPAIEPVALVARLAARLGRHPDELLAGAVRSEYVRIPMGGTPPPAGRPVVAFGAAAGYVHPATGYSLAASVRRAAPVADAVADAASAAATGSVIDPTAVSDAVWPTSMRRTRALHEYGLETLLRLDSADVRAFFSAFFDLPVERWSTFLRLDASPADTAAVMSELFRSSSWRLRRRLVAGNPGPLARLVRP